MRNARHGCVLLICVCSWIFGGCDVDPPETITGPAEKASGWVISSAQLLHPDGLKGGGAAYAFERSTFRRVDVSRLSPQSLYILGIVTAEGKIYWEEAFDPGIEQWHLVPWTPPKQPATKPATADLRGDVSGDGVVNGNDAIFLFAWLAGGISLPSLDTDLGDIDDNGKTDWMDLALLGAWVYADPRPSSNPHGIGEPIAEPLSARIVPDPSTFDFAVEGKFYRFQLKLTGGKGTEIARIYINNVYGEDRILDGSTYQRTSTSCSYSRYRRLISRSNNGVFYLARCGYGESSVAVYDLYSSRSDAQKLVEYEVVAEAPPEATEFNIDLVFVRNEDFTFNQKHQIQLAAERWESIIVKDVRNETYFIENPRSEWDSALRAQISLRDEVDDIRIFVGLGRWEGAGWARGGVGWTRGGEKFPITGRVIFHADKLDRVERNGFYLTALHEIAHCLGFTDNLWGPDDWNLIRLPSANDPGSDAHFIGTNAIAAFNRLGGSSYRGNKVPLENSQRAASSRDSHWRESVFQNELMDPWAEVGAYLSEITIGAFEDMGYEVDYSQADDYRLPRQTSKPVAHDHPESWCEVLHPVGAITPDGELIEF